MKKRILCAVVCAGLVAAGAGIAGPVHFDPGGTGSREAAPPLATDRGDCGSDVLTQSTNPNVIGAATVICGDSETSSEFSLARSFVAPYTMSVECVTFGVRLNVGPAWPARVRILLGSTGAPYDSLTLLAEGVVLVPADASFEFHTVSMPDHLIPAGTEFIVELRADSRVPADGGDGGLLGFGCNVQGQTAPTYYRGPACGQPDFTNLADIGFGGRHLVMSLGVEAVAPPVNDGPLDSTFVSMGTVAPFTTVGASTDGPNNSCANAADVWFTVQAGAESVLSIGLLAHDGADMAIALYDIGPAGVFMPDQLESLLVGCADAPTLGEESAVFDVTPGNFYLVQIGNGANGILPGTGGVGFSPDPGTPAVDLSVLACVPCVGCVGMPYSQFFALSGDNVGAAWINDCADCPAPVPPCPCIDDTSRLVAYWPMEVDFATYGLPAALDHIGSTDLIIQPGGSPTYDIVHGVSGAAVARRSASGPASTNSGSASPFTDVGQGSFSLSAWVRAPAGTTSNVIEAPGAGTGWSVSITPNGGVRLDITSAGCPSGSPVSLSRTSDLKVGPQTWSHIAVVVSKPSTGCATGGGVMIYVNGVLSGFNGGPAGPAPLPGLYFDCAAQAYHVGGPGVWLDEMMLFDAPLPPTRVQEIFARSISGPCTFTIRQAPYVDCLFPQAQLEICNVLGAAGAFNYSLFAIPGACTIGVSPANGSIFVPNGSCVTVPITLSQLGCVTNTVFGQWVATVSDGSGSSPSQARLSAVRCQSVVIGGGQAGGLLGIRTGEAPTDLVLDLTNVSGAPIMATYSLGVVNPNGDPDNAMFSINGLPPGEPVPGVLSLAAGGFTPVPISLDALSVDVLGVYELTLSIDLAGGSNFEPSDSIGLKALPPLPIAPCPGDANGDNVIDFADLNVLLSSFNTAAPSPNYNPAADFDNDGDVDFSDLNVLLSVFNTTC
ncbi:MAG: hypothetical protein IBJ10_06805 [Phycisphaerales bacterium]|nr:hypothetical protein [Phycisphaerales bacterium]